MDDEIRVPVSLPHDYADFQRRECLSCERQFKWFSHQDGDADADADAEIVNQRFCPLCGVASGTDFWWTPAQPEYMKGVGRPAMDQYVQESNEKMFRGVEGMKFKPNRSFLLGVETPEALAEPDDMQIAKSPCHPNEPVKVPEQTTKVHCLVCGIAFAI